MQLLKDVAQQARYQAMLPAAITERQALAQAIDAANAPTPINHTPVRNGRSCAVCLCCNRKSRATPVDDDGEPDLWKMGSGWSQAPLPANYVHRDGSVGSTYTCPACNARLIKGEALPVRRTGVAS